jgi:5'-methylthioinosine phosphorylase
MKLAIIGGSLLKNLDIFTIHSEEIIKTPFGQTSDSVLTGDIDGAEVIFLNRHGHKHQFAPHQVNYKANIFALKILDISDIVSVAAVGGITESMAPSKWVVPDQLIDYTHGRMHTFNAYDDTTVDHVDFTYPFTAGLRKQLISALSAEGLEHETMATYGVTQGPRLETAAEIQRMKRDGCDIVGMTAMPEAVLARELGMNYAIVSNVVNWAAGLTHGGVKASEDSGTVTMEEIESYIKKGDRDLKGIIQQFIGQLA